MVFHPHSTNVENNINSEILILNTPIEYVYSYLYLGVDIDNLLTFKKYFSNIFKKNSYKLSLLRRIRYMVTLKASLDITKTMFCSIVDYGNILLSSCYEIDLKNIQTLQNHALRCCHNVQNYRYEHVLDLHNRLNVNMVNVRRKRQILTCIWRNIKKEIIKLAVPARETRYNDAPTIYLPEPKTELFKKSVFYYGQPYGTPYPVKLDFLIMGAITEIKKKPVYNS